MKSHFSLGVGYDQNDVLKRVTPDGLTMGTHSSNTISGSHECILTTNVYIQFSMVNDLRVRHTWHYPLYKIQRNKQIILLISSNEWSTKKDMNQIIRCSPTNLSHCTRSTLTVPTLKCLRGERKNPEDFR